MPFINDIIKIKNEQMMIPDISEGDMDNMLDVLCTFPFSPSILSVDFARGRMLLHSQLNLETNPPDNLPKWNWQI